MRKFLVIAIALLAVVSCKENKPEVVPVDGPFEVEIAPAGDQSIGAPSRADVFTFFPKGSKVGLYMVNYDLVSGNAVALKNSGNHADNQCFFADASGVLRITPPVYYPEKEVATKVDIYAYYPYVDAMKTNVAACPFVVATNQRDSASFVESDLCWAKNLRATPNVGITPSATPVPMEFVHKFSKIAISVLVPSISASGKKVEGIENLQVRNVYNATTLNLSTGAVTLKNSVSDTRVIVMADTTKKGVLDGDAYLFEAIIPAQTFVKDSSLIAFDIKYEDKTKLTIVYKVSDATFGASKTAVLAGKLHKINLKLNTAFEVTLTGSQITDWTTGITQSGVVDNNVTTSFKVILSEPTATAVDQVIVTTDYEGTFDITKGVTFDPLTKECKFTFESNKKPRDYGFRITKLEFLNAKVSVSAVTKNSARVYQQGEMDLGTW